MTDTTYTAPVVAWHTTLDRGTVAVLPDGRRITVAEWRDLRISREEYTRLAALKRENHPLSIQAYDENTGYSTHPADHR